MPGFVQGLANAGYGYVDPYVRRARGKAHMAPIKDLRRQNSPKLIRVSNVRDLQQLKKSNTPEPTLGRAICIVSERLVTQSEALIDWLLPPGPDEKPFRSDVSTDDDDWSDSDGDSASSTSSTGGELRGLGLSLVPRAATLPFVLQARLARSALRQACYFRDCLHECLLVIVRGAAQGVPRLVASRRRRWYDPDYLMIADVDAGSAEPASNALVHKGILEHAAQAALAGARKVTCVVGDHRVVCLLCVVGDYVPLARRAAEKLAEEDLPDR